MCAPSDSWSVTAIPAYPNSIALLTNLSGLIVASNSRMLAKSSGCDYDKRTPALSWHQPPLIYVFTILYLLYQRVYNLSSINVPYFES